MLTDRRQMILRALVEEYVEFAIPVASRTIVDNYNLNVSSATVRNDLSYLEDSGYILQPHTSAGRIPTDAGYREFVDEIIDEVSDSDDAEYESRVSEIRKSADTIDRMLEDLSAEIARLTHCLSIIAPDCDSDEHRAIAKRGITSIMRQPEFRESSTLLPLMEILEDNTVLFKALSDKSTSGEIQIRIGEENANEHLRGVSVVTASFGEEGSGGVVAVIGPTRMNYSDVIKAVSLATDVLKEV
jgi:transcriptional regulator of heat shock response